MGWKKIKELTKSENFITILFVTCSLGAFILASIFYFLFIVLAKPAVAPLEQPVAENQLGSPDPLITKIPNLKDMIKKPLLTAADPSLGPAEAPVQIVIFSDFTCKFCRQQEQIITDLLTAYPEKILLLRKDYPEGQETSLAWQAALAGRCADEQNKFWMMSDEFSRAKNLDQALISTVAKKIKLNLSRFNQCLASADTKQLILDNIEEANVLNISGVPYIFINDKEFIGETDMAELKTAIDSILNNGQ